MFDEGLMNRIQSGEAFVRKPCANFDLDTMDAQELIDLLSEIERRLPATSLRGMDLERELVLQYLKVKALQDKVMTDEATPANQQAQVANAVVTTLQNLVTMQAKFHTSERLKEIEARLIKALNKVPTQYLEEFFEWYESEAE